MLQPPEQFAQLKVLQWTAPLFIGVLIFASLKSHGLASGDVLLWITGATIVLTWLLAMQAVWGSSWGSRHQLVTVVTGFLLVVAPLATLLLPYVPPTGAMPVGWRSVCVVLALLGLLLLSAWHHARRSPMPQGHAHRVSWPPCQIDLAKQTLRIAPHPQSSGAQPVALTSVGAASVGLYHWLANQTSEQYMLLLGVVIALTMSVWLCLWPMGRTLGQAWRLRALEAQRGVRILSSRIQWLQQERQKHWVGRHWPTQ